MTEKDLNLPAINQNMENLLGQEYTITPSRLINGITYFIIGLFIFLICFLPLLIYMVDGNFFLSIGLFFLEACIMIPILIGAWAYSPQRYIVTDKKIRIVRLTEDVIIPLKEISSIEDKEINVFKTMKLMANGGIFSMTGSFYNKEDGKFWMYTKNEKYVMLITPEKKIVVSPDEKEQFMISIRNQLDRMRKAKKPTRKYTKKHSKKHTKDYTKKHTKNYTKRHTRDYSKKHTKNYNKKHTKNYTKKHNKKYRRTR